MGKKRRALRKNYDEAVLLYRKGSSLQNLADKYGISRHAMTQVLRRRDVVIRPKFIPRIVCRSSRREEDRDNRNWWRRLQRSLAHINIESREEELERLIAEQARDDRTYQVKYELSYDESAAELDYQLRNKKVVYKLPI